MDPIPTLDPFPEPRVYEFRGERERVAVSNPKEGHDGIRDEAVRELALAVREAENPEPGGRWAGLEEFDVPADLIIDPHPRHLSLL
jgi:hypothetical protein